MSRAPRPTAADSPNAAHASHLSLTVRHPLPLHTSHRPLRARASCRALIMPARHSLPAVRLISPEYTAHCPPHDACRPRRAGLAAFGWLQSHCPTPATLAPARARVTQVPCWPPVPATWINRRTDARVPPCAASQRPPLAARPAGRRSPAPRFAPPCTRPRYVPVFAPPSRLTLAYIATATKVSALREVSTPRRPAMLSSSLAAAAALVSLVLRVDYTRH
ncbi:hypothetical protein GGX14DRAFT_572880 [Mycena pura]|uniref:Uncharacterized protein n=1 Tax=Mycena pura TaxID=153505 RepID=A0AAD6YAM7_9AGAR|nr:hypothetical protein GGX14DRAFT_572880 [Mycena pura]